MLRELIKSYEHFRLPHPPSDSLRVSDNKNGQMWSAVLSMYTSQGDVMIVTDRV